MTTPQWTVDDDSAMYYGPFGADEHFDVWDVARYINEGPTLGTYAENAYDALVDAVRDADRLATLAYGLRDTHWDDDGHCHEDGFTYPCSTIRLVNELAPEAPS